jgi:hypothetical protein
LLNPLQCRPIAHGKFTIPLITLTGREGGALAASLYGSQVKTLSNLFSSVQLCPSLKDAISCFILHLLGLTTDGKYNLSVLLEFQRDMDLYWLLTDHQGTYPYHLAQMQDVPLFLHCTSHGQSNSRTCHLQIGDSRHDTLPTDHVIGQEKLLTVKGRAELLFPQCGGVAMNQRMEHVVTPLPQPMLTGDVGNG